MRQQDATGIDRPTANAAPLALRKRLHHLPARKVHKLYKGEDAFLDKLSRDTGVQPPSVSAASQDGEDFG